jgi:Universal stress protein family
MNKGILCMTDFSESSKGALTWSVSLAQVLGTNLTILFTYRLLNSNNGEVIELRKKIEENARVNFATVEKELLTGKGVKYDFKIEVGFVSNRVKDYANKNAASFIVIGNKMNSGNKESFDELAANIQVPLVIVP